MQLESCSLSDEAGRAWAEGDSAEATLRVHDRWCGFRLICLACVTLTPVFVLWASRASAALAPVAQGEHNEASRRGALGAHSPNSPTY